MQSGYIDADSFLPLKRGLSRHDVVRTGQIFKHNITSTRLKPCQGIMYSIVRPNRP